MPEDNIKNLGPRDSFLLILTRKSDPNFVILDVRTPKEYEIARIEGSVNLDRHSPTFEADLEALDRKKTYLVYCLVGVRSSQAAGIMERLGFEDVVNMVGGIRQWHREGLPISGR